MLSYICYVFLISVVLGWKVSKVDAFKNSFQLKKTTKNAYQWQQAWRNRIWNRILLCEIILKAYTYCITFFLWILLVIVLIYGCTVLDRSFMWKFMLVCLGAGLCLMFAVAIGARGFKFLQCPCFCFPSWLWDFLINPSQKETVSWSFFNCNPLFYTRALLVWW